MPRTKRKNKGSWSDQNHDILAGKASIFRVRNSGDVWQFRMWVTEEEKYVRKSLRTKDQDTAFQRAEDLVFKTLSDVASGRKIFGTTLQVLIKSFLDYRYKDVEVGNITKGRWKTIESQTKHIFNYKSLE